MRPSLMRMQLMISSSVPVSGALVPARSSYSGLPAQARPAQLKPHAADTARAQEYLG